MPTGIRATDFIGSGVAFPVACNNGGAVALVSGERELEEAMRLILLTYPGERPMRAEFGSRVRDFVFRASDAGMGAELAHEVKTALLRWEPRVDIVSVTATPDAGSPSTMFIDIEYQIKGTNDRRNLVFPFYSIPDDGSDY
jgi:phage baseplate assembly protein W